MGPGNYKQNHQRRPVLKLVCWNVRTMMTVLFANQQDIKDSRNTAVIKINIELRRLNMDMATLQETWLADFGNLKEKDYTFFWWAQRARSRICNEEQIAVFNTRFPGDTLAQSTGTNWVDPGQAYCYQERSSHTLLPQCGLGYRPLLGMLKGQDATKKIPLCKDIGEPLYRC